jgi:hypothetical protein
MASRGTGLQHNVRKFEPKDTLAQTARYGGTTAVFGALIAGIFHLSTTQNIPCHYTNRGVE